MTKLSWVFVCGLSVAMALAVPVGISALELTSNGGFETGDFADWLQFPTAGGQQTVTDINPSSGTFAGEIFNNVEASNSHIRQANLGIDTVVPDQTVSISFDARGLYGIGGVAIAELFSESAAGGVSKTEILGGGPLGINDDSSVWTTFNFTTTLGPDVSGGVTLLLGATNGAVPNETTTMWYDNVSVSIESAVSDGDFNSDGMWNCTDIDALVAAIAGASADLTFDLNGDGLVDVADITDAGTGWLAVGGANNPADTGGNAFLVGDADLNGTVDGQDFLVWNSNKFSSNAAWCSGDFNADGFVDGQDFLAWNANKFTSSDVSSVPEPAAGGLVLLSLMWLRRHRNN